MVHRDINAHYSVGNIIHWVYYNSTCIFIVVLIYRLVIVTSTISSAEVVNVRAALAIRI